MYTNPIISIAKKEVMDNIRNKWVIIITIVFAALAILASYAGSIFSQGWQDLSLTIGAMSTLVQYIVTIIALILGYSTIIGEIEKGSMNSLLSLSISRLEVLIGKIIGLGIILSISIFIGFGLAGIIIGLNIPDPNYGEYLLYIFASIFMALIFLSLGILLSCVFKKRSSAMGAAVFVWIFYAIIWVFISAGLLIATTDLSNIESFNIPDWYYVIQFLNPAGPYSGLVSLNFASGLTNTSEIPGLTYPSFYTNEVMMVAGLIWLVVPFLLAYLIVNRSEI